MSGSAQSPQVYPCMHCTLSSSEYEDLPLSLDVRVVRVSYDLHLEKILQSLELQPLHYTLSLTIRNQ